jgi:hypothetical protein
MFKRLQKKCSLSLRLLGRPQRLGVPRFSSRNKRLDLPGLLVFLHLGFAVLALLLFVAICVGIYHASGSWPLIRLAVSVATGAWVFTFLLKALENWGEG